MAVHKKKIIKGNLKTSLYFAGGITFGTVAIGAGISIPVYISIQKSLKEAMKSFAQLSGYMSQLAAKLGLPTDSSFEQELAHGYEAVYTPGKGTQIFKQINGEKVLMMATNPDGTVKTAAQFEGVEALTMMDAIGNAKEAFGNEADAMNSIMDQYGSVAEDQSYITESLSTGNSVALLVLRDALLSYYDKTNPSNTSNDAQAIIDAQGKYDEIQQRNSSDPSVPIFQINSSLITPAKSLIKATQEAMEQDKQAAAGGLTEQQKADLQAQRDAANQKIQDAQKQIDEAKVAAATKAAEAAANAAQVTQNKVMQNIETTGDGSSAQNKFLDANTATIQKWLPIFGATFGNDEYKDSTGKVIIQAQTPSAILRKSISEKLQEKGMDISSLNKMIGEIMDIIGLGSEKAQWEHTTDKAQKKILSVTQVLSTFSSTASEDSRVIVLNIIVKNVSTNTNESYILLGHPKGTTISYNFDKFHIEGSNYGVLNTQNDFNLFMSTVNQLSLMAQPSTGLVQNYTSDIKTNSLKQITNIINIINDDASADIKKIKLTTNSESNAQLDAFTNSDIFKNNPKYSDLANKLFASNFTDLNNKNIKFSRTSLNALLTQFNSDDVSGKIYDYFFTNLSNLNSNLTSLQTTYLNNSKAFKDFGIFDKVVPASETKMLFNDSTLFKTNLNIVPKDKTSTAALNVFTDEFFALLEAAKPDAKVSLYVEEYKFYNSLGLNSALIDKLRPTLKAFSNDNVINRIKTIEEQYNSQTPLEFTKPNWKPNDAVKDYISNHIDQVVEQILQDIDIKPYVQNLNWVYSLDLSKNIEDKIIPLALNKINLTIFSDLLKLSSDTTWKPIAANGDISQTPIDAIKKFINDQSQMFIDQINGGKDITIIKESIRYAYKGINISDPDTQNRIDAAKDVAKDIDNIKGINASDKQDIQQAVENVITKSITLTAEQFATIMKYTQTVFKLFPDPAAAAAQLKKVLDPTTLTDAVVTNIAKLNTWVETIETTNPGVSITLDMIKTYVWAKEMFIADFDNTNYADDGQDIIVGALTNPIDGRVYLVSHRKGDLYEIQQNANKNTSTKFTSISKGKVSPSDYISNATITKNGNIWFTTLESTSKVQTFYIYKFDAAKKSYDQVPYSFTQTISQDINSVRSIVATENYIYSISSGATSGSHFTIQKWDNDDSHFNSSNHTYTPPATIIDSQIDTAWPVDSVVSWAYGTFNNGSQEYLYFPVTKDKQLKIFFYKVNSDGSLVSPTYLDIPSSVIPESELSSSNNANPPVITAYGTSSITGTTSTDFTNNKGAIYITTLAGNVFEIGIDFASGVAVVDEKQSMVLLSNTLASDDKWFGDTSKTTSGIRGIAFDKTSGEVQVMSREKILYIPDQSKDIRDIYDSLLS